MNNINDKIDLLCDMNLTLYLTDEEVICGLFQTNSKIYKRNCPRYIVKMTYNSISILKRCQVPYYPQFNEITIYSNDFEKYKNIYNDLEYILVKTTMIKTIYFKSNKTNNSIKTELLCLLDANKSVVNLDFAYLDLNRDDYILLNSILLHKSSTLESLTIMSYDILFNELNIIAPGLQNHQQLKKLHISSSKIDEFFIEILANIFHHNKSIQCLKIKQEPCIEVISYRPLFNVLQCHNNTLTNLSLTNIMCVFETMQSLTECLSVNTSIHTLRINSMEMPSDQKTEVINSLTQLIINSPHLTKLNYSSAYNFTDDDELFPIINALSKNKTLTTLYLHNNFTDIQTLNIFEMLCNHPSIQNFRMPFCESIYTPSLSKLLKTNKILKHISLQYCNIDNTQISIIIDALKTNTTLLQLDLRYNEIDNVHFLNELFEMNTTLQQINISWNQIPKLSYIETTLLKNNKIII